MDVSKEEKEQVINALANNRFKWRTVKGISGETGINGEKIRETMAQLSDKIIKSSAPSVDGQELYTTREHFRKKASGFEKIIGAIKNRAI